MEEPAEVVELEDINALYAQIRKDPKFLENIERIPFVDTPLHAAARTGNTELVIEITKIKPSFARKLIPYGFSPTHIALQKGQTQTVPELIDIDPELVCAKGRKVCPTSLEDVTTKARLLCI
ncbi:Ankyrin repeat family protein [Melia azedarach]|uniref:Ankyrin repeat family protein n=1 Tax=Melia azedarach TaxID=155640 RepID=A0ACC1YV34_MELAZ|nr:Ankyrin repeat family protein [Melia azedarach]